MNKKYLIYLSITGMFVISGCETTNSIPYKASTDNVIALQEEFESSGNKVRLGEFSIEGAPSLTCRLMGPVKVAPGKTLPEYIKDAFQEELFLAKAYSTGANVAIDGDIKNISFSSVAPANWDITMHVSSNVYEGYSVSTKYEFDTSWSAYSACKNVADAFGPAVQELLNQVITHPEFDNLVSG